MTSPGTGGATRSLVAVASVSLLPLLLFVALFGVSTSNDPEQLIPVSQQTKDLLTPDSFLDTSSSEEDDQDDLGETLLGQHQQFDVQDEDTNGRDKRAPSGFMGMRGKKTPSGFMGVRGRRTPDEFYYTDYTEEEKRAPSGFMGMRGKKAPLGFMGMRGKKAAPSGFMGVRGKKASPPQNLNDLILALSSRYRTNYGYKRAPLGFIGMRGRRSDSSPLLAEPQQSYSSLTDDLPDKRAPSGFMGMRG